ncbi:hypothetical protein ASE49_12485 [Novosphingobium sp. Leaf2]|nr:hypothetical protein ASE49_12485 [Novosphingobium sp. Leaf2]
MLDTLSSLQARLLIVVIVLLGAWTLTIQPLSGSGGAAITGDGTYSDIRLYHDIGDAVANGEGYYHAAIRLHRAHGFPTRPFVTVRLPTLAWIEAALGWPATRAMLRALLLITALAWYAMLRPMTRAPERIAATLLTLGGGAMAASDTLMVSHELWAGVLIALASALLARGHVAAAIVAAACALAIRELAVPFVAIGAYHAWRGGHRRALLAWMGLLVAYAAALMVHRAMVMPLSLPGDAVSQGWDALRGPEAPLRDIVDVSLLNLMPRPWCYLAALLALVGFMGAPRPLARIALPWLGSIVFLLAVFARPVNFYWAILIAPTILAGLAFLPRTAHMLAAAALKRPLPA